MSWSNPDFIFIFLSPVEVVHRRILLKIYGQKIKYVVTAPLFIFKAGSRKRKLKSTMKVLVIGELNVDLILNEFSSFPIVGKEVLAQKMNITLGSSSAIFASNLSNLGNQVTFLGMTGKDEFGTTIINSLKSHNVDTSVIIQSDQYATGLTVILNAGEDRANVTFPGAMKHFSEKMIDFTLFQHFDPLHLSSFFIQPLLASSIPIIFQMAREYGLSTSFDMQWDPL